MSKEMTFKLLKGTVIKLHEHPAQLTQSLEVTCRNGNYLIENITIIDDETYFDKISNPEEE